MASTAQWGVLIVSHESRVSLFVVYRLGRGPPSVSESCSFGKTPEEPEGLGRKGGGSLASLVVADV